MPRTFALLSLALTVCPPAHASEAFLESHQAFKLIARSAGPEELELRFSIAPGHYMYRHVFQVRAASGDLLPIQAALPAGRRHFDEAFSKEVETYRGRLHVTLPIGALNETLEVTGQGCADKGLCYPPMTAKLSRLSDGSWRPSQAGDELTAFGAAAWQDSGHAGSSTQPQLGVLSGLALGILVTLLASRRV